MRLRWTGILSLGACFLVAAPVPGTTFDFNDGTAQGWTTAGLMDTDLNPIAGSFAEGPASWRDRQNSPGSPPGFDPAGNNIGTIGVGSLWRWYPAGPDGLWVWDFTSPDLSAEEQWQSVTRIELDLTSVMQTDDPNSQLWAQFIIIVEDPNMNERIFAECTASGCPVGCPGGWVFHPLPVNQAYEFSSWQAYAWDLASDCIPQGSTTKHFRVRIFGQAATHQGFVMVDNVQPVRDCGAFGGDSDGDGLCDDGPGDLCTAGANTFCRDNCKYMDNPNQADSGGIADQGPDGSGDACQCGDVTGEGIVNGTDATFITRKALNLFSPLFNVPGNCDVTGDGQCNGTDATFITRKALNLFSPLFGNNCPNFTDSCVVDSFGNCIP